MRSKSTATWTRMESDLRDKTDIDSRNDYAVSVARLGDYSKAITILNEIEKQSPGLYFTATNLGTVYELAGNNKEALKWIAEGIKRNKKSHEGTEWLHARILEAKIKQAEDPTYLLKHSVLDLDWNAVTGKETEFIIHGTRIPSNAVQKALLYQLEERMQLVKPKDLVVAQLLHDYAELIAATSVLEDAIRLHQLSMEYGYPDRVAVENEVARMEHTIQMARVKPYFKYAAYLLLALGLVAFVFKKKWITFRLR